MKTSRLFATLIGVSLVFSAGAQAQETGTGSSGGTTAPVSTAPPGSPNSPTSSPQPPSGAIPRLVKFSGSVMDLAGKPVTGVLGLTFALYEQSEGGTPLWQETQTLALNAQGHYAALLGAETPGGLPLELFTGSQALWVGVQPQMPGESELPRVLLVAVPYALKSSDADTLGGLPASAYMLATSANAAGSVVTPGTPPVYGPGGNPTPPPGSGSSSPTSAVGGSGTVNTVPMFTATTTLGNSPISITTGSVTGSVIASNSGASSPGSTGTASVVATMSTVNFGSETSPYNLNVSGELTAGGVLLPSLGTATSSGGFNSNALSLTGSVYNSNVGAAQPISFAWLTEPTDNNTTAASGSLNLQYSTGGGPWSETGLSVASNGQITFAPGQTFPGGGSGGSGGSITAVNTPIGSGLAGGGTSGALTLSLLTSCPTGQVLRWSGAGWACSVAGTVTEVDTGAGLIGGPIVSTGALSIATAGVTDAMLANAYSGVGPCAAGSFVNALNRNLPPACAAAPELSANNIWTGANTFNGMLNGNTAIFSVLNLPATTYAATGQSPGAIYMATSSTGSSSTTYTPLLHACCPLTNATGNTFVGLGSGNFIMTGQAGTTYGQNNTGTGAAALSLNYTGYNNTADGYQALQSNDIGSDDTAVGALALQTGQFGSYNTAVGANALQMYTGAAATAVGYGALAVNTSGQVGTANTAIGYFALHSDTTGGYNTADGNQALFANVAANDNTATGSGALINNNNNADTNNNANDNTADGYDALEANTSGGENTAVGSEALSDNSTGAGNTGIGYLAGYTDGGSITGVENTFIGAFAAGSAGVTNLSNATAIGANAHVACSNCLVLGSTEGLNPVNDSETSPVTVLIGTPTLLTPSTGYALEVEGGTLLNGGVTIEGNVSTQTADVSTELVVGGSSTSSTPAALEVSSLNYLSEGEISTYINGGASVTGGLTVDSLTVTNTANVTNTLTVNSLTVNDCLTVNLVSSGNCGTEGEDARPKTNIQRSHPLPKTNIQPSDMRLKTNIQPFQSSLDLLAKLQPVHFNWRASNPAGYPVATALNTGLIAQDVQKVFPELVTTDSHGYLQVNYTPLPFMLLEGVRELKAREDGLKSQLRDQEEQIVSLNEKAAAKDAQIAALSREVEQLRKAQEQTAALLARWTEAQSPSAQVQSTAASSRPTQAGRSEVGLR